MLAVYAALFLAAPTAADAATFGQLAENLSRVRKEFRTVEIEFTLERRDAVIRKPENFVGTFVALRTDFGLYAQLQFRSETDPAEVETYVLRGDDLTEWLPSKKAVTRYSASQTKGGFRFAADNLSGLLWLLDRDQTAKYLRPRAFKRDEHYAYFDVKADETPSWALFGKPQPVATDYRLVMTLTDSADFPRHTIRQVYKSQPSGDTQLWKVTKWSVDSPKHAKVIPSDFPDPDKLPEGWTLKTLTWPPTIRE
jgi:hypothetical protein